jgi:hypothetical protein
MHLVIQPCGHSAARQHFVDTIENPVHLTKILPYLAAEERNVVERTFATSVAVWGLTPATDGSNAAAWEKMEIGDIALLCRDRRFFFRGTIAFKVRNRPGTEGVAGVPPR